MTVHSLSPFLFSPCFLCYSPFPCWACPIGCGRGLCLFVLPAFSPLVALLSPNFCCCHASLVLCHIWTFLKNIFFLRMPAKIKTDHHWVQSDQIKKQWCSPQECWQQHSSWISCFLILHIFHFLWREKKHPKHVNLSGLQTLYFLSPFFLDFLPRLTSISCVRSPANGTILRQIQAHYKVGGWPLTPRVCHNGVLEGFKSFRWRSRREKTQCQVDKLCGERQWVEVIGEEEETTCHLAVSGGWWARWGEEVGKKAGAGGVHSGRSSMFVSPYLNFCLFLLLALFNKGNVQNLEKDFLGKSDRPPCIIGR